LEVSKLGIEYTHEKSEMTTKNYFVSSDYDLNVHLQKLFQDYVALHTSIHGTENKSTLSNEDRLILTKTSSEMTLLVMKMKLLLSDNEILIHQNNGITSVSMRGNLESYSDQLVVT